MISSIHILPAPDYENNERYILSIGGLLNGRADSKYKEKNLPHHHFVCFKSHIDFPEIEPKHPQ
jgi:hypothetical protein